MTSVRLCRDLRWCSGHRSGRPRWSGLDGMDGVQDAGQALAERVAGLFHPTEMHLVEFGPVISTHAGPGTLGLSPDSEEVGYESA